MKFTNENSIIKDNIRRFLVKECRVEKYKDEIHVFSLPANNFHFEKYLETKYPEKTFVFTCIEKDPEVYASGVNVLKGGYLRSEVEYICTDTSKFFTNNTKQFDIIWLDYCSQFCQNVIDDMANISLSQDGLLAVTLLGRREKKMYTTELLKSLPKKQQTLMHVRRIAIPKVLGLASNTKINTMYRYRDGLEQSNASPMYLYVFRRTDEKTKLINLTCTKEVI